MPARSITPTLVARASHCLHAWHLECHGDASLKLEPDAGMRLIIDRGIAYEGEVVAGIEGVVEPDWDGKKWEAGRQATLGLRMRARGHRFGFGSSRFCRRLGAYLCPARVAELAGVFDLLAALGTEHGEHLRSLDAGALATYHAGRDGQ
jgi:hypothetical protein